MGLRGIGMDYKLDRPAASRTRSQTERASADVDSVQFKPSQTSITSSHPRRGKQPAIALQDRAKQGIVGVSRNCRKVYDPSSRTTRPHSWKFRPSLCASLPRRRRPGGASGLRSTLVESNPCFGWVFFHGLASCPWPCKTGVHGITGRHRWTKPKGSETIQVIDL